MQQRFQSLRDYGRLPRGRERRTEHLSALHIADALLAQVATKPNWAGHGAVVLGSLRSMGGPDAGFRGAPTLVSAIKALVEQQDAREQLVAVRLSLAEVSRGLNGAASIVVDEDNGRRTYGYASQLSATTWSPLREPWDYETPGVPAARELVLGRRLFVNLAREIESSARWPEPPGDGEEYDADDARRAREARLKVRPNSYFLNLGVDTHAAWPRVETLVPFDGYELVLMPRTADHQTSVHIDLARFGLTMEAANTVVRRFLSTRAWEDDQFAILEYGWAGNSGPIPVSRRNLAFTVGAPELFARRSPADATRRRALSYYRAGCNAHMADLISFAFLSFWKILELHLGEPADIRAWIATNLPILRGQRGYEDDWQAFDEVRGEKEPENYLQRACRVAVAHASFRAPSDEDDEAEVRRLHIATAVIRRLARRLMDLELGMRAAVGDEVET